MYKIIIETQYNIIELERDGCNTPDLIEIYEQPWVKNIKIEQVKEDDKPKVLKKT